MQVRTTSFSKLSKYVFLVRGIIAIAFGAPAPWLSLGITLTFLVYLFGAYRLDQRDRLQWLLPCAIPNRMAGHVRWSKASWAFWQASSPLLAGASPPSRFFS